MQAFASGGSGAPRATDPAQLATIAVPVLVLFGTRSVPRSWFIDGAHHVAEHVAEPHLRSIEGVGHMAPYLEPRAVADEITAFLSGVDVPA